MGEIHGPRIVTDGLVFAVDPGSERCYSTNNMGIAWNDYQNSLALGRYSILGPYSILINTSYASWIGSFNANIETSEKYTVMFDYVADAASSLVMDNDGSNDNIFNVTLGVTTSVQTYSATATLTVLNTIQIYLRRNGGGNITVSNFRFFKTNPAYSIINNASGTLTNGVSYTTSNGGAFGFDGVDDFILFPDDTNLNLQTLTMESWCYPNDNNNVVNQNGFLFEKGLVNTQYANFFEGTTFVFRTMGLSGSSLSITSSLFSANSWNHIACTYVSGTKRIYLNGIQVGLATGLTGTIPTNTNGPRIGAHSSGYYLDGKIAVSRVYNKALTQAEVTQNFNAQKSRFGL